jgi:hypothetical protein
LGDPHRSTFRGKLSHQPFHGNVFEPGRGDPIDERLRFM